MRVSVSVTEGKSVNVVRMEIDGVLRDIERKLKTRWPVFIDIMDVRFGCWL